MTTDSAGDDPRRLPGEDLTPEEQALMQRRLPPRSGEPVTTRRLVDDGLLGDHFTVRTDAWHAVIEGGASLYEFDGYDTTIVDLWSVVADPGQDVFDLLGSANWRVALLDADASEIVRESKPAQVV